MTLTPTLLNLTIHVVSTPHEIRRGDGFNEIFSYNTPADEWPEIDPQTDSIVRGRADHYKVSGTLKEGLSTTEFEFTGQTRPPEVTHFGTYWATLQAWPHEVTLWRTNV